MARQVLEIGGMSCGHCVMRVRGALEKVPGVTVEDVRIGTATVSFDERSTTPATIGAAVAEAVEDAGYDMLATKGD